MDPTEPLLKNLKTFVAFARKRVGDPHLAEGVVQESLLKALKADRKPVRNDDVIAWFYRILRRGIIDVYRRSDARERALAIFTAELPERPDGAAERVICQCIKRLLPSSPNNTAICSGKLIWKARRFRTPPPTSASPQTISLCACTARGNGSASNWSAPAGFAAGTAAWIARAKVKCRQLSRLTDVAAVQPFVACATKVVTRFSSVLICLVRLRSGVDRGHFLAFLRATLAGVSAALAMIHLVFAAFLAAGAAEVGADPAQFLGKLRPARHESRRHSTEDCALMIQIDAARHFFDVLFLQTGAGAMLAFHRASVAGLDTALIFLVHNVLLFVCD
jgi:hypothetical protein